MVRRKSNASPRSSRRSDLGESSKTNVIVDRRKKPVAYARALREIRYLRKTTHLLIPRAPFARLVREIMIELFPAKDINRIQASALEALQEATEAYVVQFIEDSRLLSLHAKRITLMRQDIILMRRIRGREDVANR